MAVVLGKGRNQIAGTLIGWRPVEGIGANPIRSWHRKRWWPLDWAISTPPGDLAI